MTTILQAGNTASVRASRGQAEKDVPVPRADYRFEITDAKLLARVKQLIIAGHAGFARSGYGKIENACVEPGCSCNFDVCGLFREPAVRCSSFEQLVLPRDPELETAYWAHLKTGTELRVLRCQWQGCRREVGSTAPNAKYCARHAEVSRKKARRDASRRYRDRRAEKDAVVAVATRDNRALVKAS